MDKLKNNWWSNREVKINVIFIIIFVIMALILITTPIWAGKNTIGAYPLYAVVWFFFNIVAAAMITYYVYVVKGRLSKND